MNMRLNDVDWAYISADIADMRSLGATPPSVGAYAKHATMSYPRLRRIEFAIRQIVADDPEHASAVFLSSALRGILETT